MQNLGIPRWDGMASVEGCGTLAGRIGEVLGQSKALRLWNHLLRSHRRSGQGSSHGLDWPHILPTQTY